MVKLVIIMEIKVYLNQSAYRDGKPIFCRIISSLDVFDFHATVSVLRVLFGSDAVIDLHLV